VVHLVKSLFTFPRNESSQICSVRRIPQSHW
jgi:hypothetical protein